MSEAIRPRLALGVGIGLVLVLALLLRAPIAAMPLERDEGGYAYISLEWLGGALPYRDAFDQKPPAIYLAYLVLLRFFGSTPEAIHWGTQAYTCLTLILLAWLGTRFFSPVGGVAASAMAAYLTTHPYLLGNSSNTEIFMLLPLAGMALACLFAMEGGAWGFSLLAGLLGGACALFKQVALVQAGFFFLLVAWRATPRWRHLAAFIAGGMLPIVLTWIYFWNAGAGQEFVDAVFGYNLLYATRVPFSLYPVLFKNTFVPILLSAWPLLALASLGLVSLGRSFPKESGAPAGGAPGGLFLSGWLLFAFVATSVSGYYRKHYFIQMIPPVTLLAALGAVRLAHAVPRARWRSTLVFLVVAAAITFGLGKEWWYYGPATPWAKSRHLYGINPFAESMEVARFIADGSRPDERVFIYGSEPQILFYANRKSASRYIYVYPLLAPVPGSLERQRAALGELSKRPPRFIVVTHVYASFLTAPDSPLALLFGLQELLRRGYHVVGAVPFEFGEATSLVTGEEARRIRERKPSWKEDEACCSLVIWERNAGAGGGL